LETAIKLNTFCQNQLKPNTTFVIKTMKLIIGALSIFYFLLTTSATHRLPTKSGEQLRSRPPPDGRGRIHCGGHVPRELYYGCEADEACIDDPFVGGCGMACDRPGICVKKSNHCGGFAGFKCNGGKCVDDPTDACDPKNGGADCMGICVQPPLGGVKEEEIK
jgi:hypothetical protein